MQPVNLKVKELQFALERNMPKDEHMVIFLIVVFKSSRELRIGPFKSPHWVIEKAKDFANNAASFRFEFERDTREITFNDSPRLERI